MLAIRVETLGPFHVLVGPNASGKTTFLDVVGFLRDLVSEGLDESIAVHCETSGHGSLLAFERQHCFQLMYFLHQEGDKKSPLLLLCSS